MKSAPYELRETLLKVSGVSLSLGGAPVLRDVNLEIKNVHRDGMNQGQVVGLLGPSGIGKTTLFRVLAGLDKPDCGEVLIEQEGKPVERGMVGVVAQSYPLFAHRTVMGNMIVAGRSSGLSYGEAKRQANDVLTRFEMDAHGSKYPAQLSGGQRQRVAIAQQFMCSEHFLLMDEPFSGLDPIALGKVTGFIKEIARSDELKTFIVVTHDITAAIEVSDTLWLLGRDRDKHGNIIPGARVIDSYNLIERGLAWQDCVSAMPECQQLIQEIRQRFPQL